MTREDDTISRMAVIRWVKTECNPYGNPTLDFESGKKFIEHLEQMPPAWCSDCIANGGDWDCDHVHCHKGKQSDNDMIYLQKEQAYLQGWEEGQKALRETAIDSIQKDRETSWKELENDDAEYRNGCDDGYAYSMQIISELPSVERKGKWDEQSVFDTEDSGIAQIQSAKCSACGKYHTTPYLYFFDNFNFCPNCGARMEEE